MGVKINSRSEPAPKPLFEAVDPDEAKTQPEVGKSEVTPSTPAAEKRVRKAGIRSEDLNVEPPFPEAFSMESSPPTEGWNPVSEIPRDRPILVAWAMASLPTKWVYYEVMWYQPPNWNCPGWMVCGTRWHRLDEGMIHGWREPIGHP